ncbi:Hypothetical protein R9X50_00367600 [Acrodontium crateriforme]|uniref:MARVEL domain-containing protein n=1 Tax=Acrodontium crateriforme TaxID=150365 RepID=A0AAQ3R4E7_9PEZI|nr:Hypothetical protein R9X50_00367600 [Acrodontium crateriforme]
MRIQQTKQQKIKAVTHFTQAFFIFIAGCLALGVLTKDGGSGAQIGYYFALCFFSIPALIYQVMVPMWTRAWRFANVYAYATIDMLFVVLWFAAFVAVAQWNSAGLKKGEDSKDSAGNGTCAKFGYGSQAKCETSKAAVGFGVIVCALFIASTVLSLQAVMEFKRTGVPSNAEHKAGQSAGGKLEKTDEDEANKDAWSTNTDDVEGGIYASPFGDHNADTTYDHADRQGLLYPHDEQCDDEHSSRHSPHAENGMHNPGRAMSYGSDHHSVNMPDDPYNDAHALNELNPTSHSHRPSLSDRLNFPQGNYFAA